MKLTFNILAIIGTAMFAGVLLAIGVILGGYWKSLSPTDFLVAFSNNSQFIQRAISVVALASIVGIICSIYISWGSKDLRLVWLSAAACIVLLLIFTMIWFGPTNAQFAARSLPITEVQAKLNTWLMLHNIRIALDALASVLGVIAVRR
jgi:hypothetical protein